MIYTQYGMPCKIVSVLDGDRVVVRTDEDGAHRERGILELKADGGIAEIDAAIRSIALSSLTLTPNP